MDGIQLKFLNYSSFNEINHNDDLAEYSFEYEV